MQRLDLTLPTLAENLALDEALLLDVQAGGPATLRFWNWPHLAVVVGAGGKLNQEADLERCTVEEVPVVRRSSGGGTVLLGPGCLLYTLALPMDMNPALADLNASYRFIMNRIAQAFANVRPGVGVAGISDLVVGDRKVAGNAQQRKRAHLIHHGVFLDDFDLSAIGRYIKHPPRMPDYRQDRPHDAFVTNLKLGADHLKQILADAWSAHTSRTAWPADRVAQLVAERYGQADWHARR